MPIAMYFDYFHAFFMLNAQILSTIEKKCVCAIQHISHSYLFK